MTSLALSLTAYFFCSAILSAAPTTRPALPLIIGHRGAAADAPENTLASYRLALKDGADGIEGDFYLTKDGVIVDSHDPSLKRCGGIDRNVADMTLAEIKQVDVGSWKDPKFKGEQVPTLAEILPLVTQGKLFFIEIKCGPEIIPELLKTIDASRIPQERLRIIGFDAEVILAVKTARPALKAYWLTSFKAKEGETTKHPTLTETLATLKRIHADGLDTNGDLEVINTTFVRGLRDAGQELHVWTIDDPAVARKLIAFGVDSITTNRAGALRTSLAD